MAAHKGGTDRAMTDGARTTSLGGWSLPRALAQDPGLRELVLYFLGSGAALALDMSLLIALTELAGLNYLTSAAIGFVCGAVALYGLSVSVIFTERRFAGGPVEFAIFFAIGLAGLGINQLTMLLLVSGAGFAYPAAKLAAVGLVFTFNFTARKTVLFRPAEHRAPRAPAAGGSHAVEPDTHAGLAVALAALRARIEMQPGLDAAAAAADELERLPSRQGARAGAGAEEKAA